MEVSVTEDHIRRGIRRSFCSCPVAIALLESQKYTGMSVGITGEYVTVWGQVERYWPLPEKAKTFIDRFDNGLSVEPFEFSLDI